MFVHTIVRIRGRNSVETTMAAHRFLEAVGDENNAVILLLVCSYERGVRTVLVDSSDAPRRDREAAELRRKLPTRNAMIAYAKKIRFQELFMMLGISRSRHERAIYDKLCGEYLTSVDSPGQEEVFLRATDEIVRDVLALSIPDPSGYLASRAETAKRLRDHTTDRSFPFVGPTGLDLYQARLFDLGGEGDESYIIASVNI